jgi:hypothetical protein
MRQHLIFKQIPEAEPGQCCFQSQGGFLGIDRFWKYEGVPTTAMRRSGPMRIAIMSFSPPGYPITLDKFLDGLPDAG